MLAILGIKDHRQQARPDVTARNDVKRCRRLGDLLARAAGELLAHGLDDFPLPRHHLQRLRDRLAEFDEPAAATGTGGRTGDHHALAWQMCRKRRPHRLSAGKRTYRCALGWRGGDCILGRARRRLLELQLQLVEQLATAFGGLPVLLAPQLGDLQLVIGDQCLGAGGARLRLLPCLALGGQRCRQRGNLVGAVLGRARHGPDCRTPPKLGRYATIG